MRNGNSVYLDHQASTQLDKAAFEEMLPFFNESFANPHSSDHALGWSAAEAVERSSAKLSKLVGCDSDEIIYTSGATEANNLAIFGLRQLSKDSMRNQIITTRIEHKSVLSCCDAMMEEHGTKIDFVCTNTEGQIDLNHLEDIVSNKTLMFSIGAVNSEIGTIQKLEEIYAIASRHGAIVHFDAAQMPTAASLSGISNYADLVSLSAHKFYGPKGIGCLYVKRGLQKNLKPLIFGGGQQNGIRSGTLPVALCAGMGAAASLIEEAPELRDNLRALTSQLWSGLTSLPCDVRLNGAPLSLRHPGNLNVMFPGFQADELVGALQPYLAVSTGSACSSGSLEASYVLRAIGLTEDEARSSIRFSVGKFTTGEDIKKTLDLLSATLTQHEVSGLKEAI